jgi:Bacterial Ig domain
MPTAQIKALARPVHGEWHSYTLLRVCLCAIVLIGCSSSPGVYASDSAARQSTLSTAGTLAIARPSNGAPLSRVISLAAASRRPTELSSVEFYIGSRRLGIANSSPFALRWNTAYASDGTYSLQATGRNRRGLIVATAQQTFRINNHGNSLAVTSPDIGQPLTGIVNLTISGSDPQYYPAIWIVNMDGEEVASAWTDNAGQHSDIVTIKLDTTAYANGPHELYIAMHSDFWPAGRQDHKSWYNWRAGVDHVIRTYNGRTVMGIVANYLHVYLRPGEHAALTCNRRFTDGTSAECLSPQYVSSDLGTVSASTSGELTAGLVEGFATITVGDGGKKTSVYVWVKKSLNVPHFSGSGDMLSSYAPGSSLFVVAPFFLQASDLRDNRSLLEAIHSAGINTLSQGFYSNPRNIDADYGKWRQYYDTYIAPAWSFAAKHGMHILATGDEVCRNIGGEAWWTLNWPSGKTAVQHAFQSLVESRVAISVDMVDEASMLWGSTPTPPGRVGGLNGFNSISCSSGNCTVSWLNNPVNSSRFPSGTSFALSGSHNRGLNTPAGRLFKATRVTSNSFDFSAAGAADGTFTKIDDPNLEFLWWAGNIDGCPSQPCNPPVPNDALVEIANWLRGLQPRVPISWPPAGSAPIPVQANWMGPDSLSDYASHYWTSLRLRHTYTWSQGIEELAYWMTRAFYQRQSSMMLDRPQLMLDSISGPAYVKHTKGASYYSPAEDFLDQPGVSGPAVTATLMTAAALGAAGVRLYYFENATDASIRAAAPIGTYFQTGVSPAAGDPIIQDIWQGLSSAATALTGLLAPYLLETELNSPAYGSNIITAAREGAKGRMLMIVNDNDWLRTVRVSFMPYTYGSDVQRYRIRSDGIYGPSTAPSQGEVITLMPGETAVYLFSRVAPHQGTLGAFGVGATCMCIARRGCCSHHQGACGCKGHTIMCCDGSASPTCTCHE